MTSFTKHFFPVPQSSCLASVQIRRSIISRKITERVRLRQIGLLKLILGFHVVNVLIDKSVAPPSALSNLVATPFIRSVVVGFSVWTHPQPVARLQGGLSPGSRKHWSRPR